MRLARLCPVPLGLTLLVSLVTLPGCDSSTSTDGIAYEGNEDAVRQHMEEVADEERAHLQATAQAHKPAEQRVDEEERAQRARN